VVLRFAQNLSSPSG